MKLIKKALFTFILLIFGVNLLSFNIVAAAGDDDPYTRVLNISTDSTSLKSAVRGNPWDIASKTVGIDLFSAQVKIIIWYAISIFIVVWIAIAFLGGYKIMTSNSEDSMKDGMRLVVFGVLWIMIMFAAKFLAEWLVWNDGILEHEFAKWKDDPSWVLLAQELYERLLYPFIKIALYLVTWILFIMMAIKVISFVTSTDEAAKKKAWWIILWCVVWIFIILWAKQIVEAVMWRQESVFKASATELEQIWNKIFNFQSIPLIAQIINWVMGLTMFVIVVLLIIQGYRMFTQPDDPKNRERLKKTLLYIIIWVLIIGASFAISHVIIPNSFLSVQW